MLYKRQAMASLRQSSLTADAYTIFKIGEAAASCGRVCASPRQAGIMLFRRSPTVEVRDVGGGQMAAVRSIRRAAIGDRDFMGSR